MHINLRTLSMKANKLVETVKHNWIAKVLSFSLALALYLVHVSTTLERKTFTVPLQTKAVGLLQNTNKIPASVRVTVRSGVKQLGEMSENDFRATLDVSPFVKAGNYSVPVSLDFSSKVLKMDALEVTVHPQTVSLKLEERVALPVSVLPTIAGETNHGYEISSISVEPQFAEVQGPRSVVENMKTVSTAAIDVTGLSASKKFDAVLNNINELVSVDEKKKYRVSLVVVPQNATKDFVQVPLSLYALSPKLKAAEEPMISVSLAGELLALESYEIKEGTFFADCSEIAKEGTYELPIHTRLPENIRLASDEEMKIVLNFTKKEESEAE